MLKHLRLGVLAVVALLACAISEQGQQAPVNGQAGGGPGGAPVGPTQTDRYRSDFVKLGGNAADGLLYNPVLPGANPRVAVVATYQVPATELANRGYRVMFVRHTNQPDEVASPLEGFEEISRGIAYLRKLPGVKRVVVIAWGSGAGTMIFYADVAEHGPAACQGKEILYPCKTPEASGLAKPDGVILLDPGLGAGSKVVRLDPAYESGSHTKLDLDVFAAANGYDAKTGTATYPADFRKRYFAAQSARNNQIIDDAVARLKLLDQGKGSTAADEPLLIPGGAETGSMAGLHYSDLNLLSHTKRPHTLLKADGSKPDVILKSIRPPTGPVGEDAIKKLLSQGDRLRQGNYTLRQFLANDAIRTTKDFALTDDDVIGMDWKSSNAGSPAQAEGISVPTLVMTNTCFQFVVPSEIVYDHLAAKDKTMAGVEGSEHFFTPCAPQYGDTKKRLFDFVDGWLAKPGRF
jgi:hypothetical protein